MSTIKPKDIFSILDTTVKIRELGGDYVPCFAGDSGIGKSQVCQAWAKKNGYTLIDLRLAYMEGPDMVGMPQSVEVTVNGKKQWVTIHSLPDFLPKNPEEKVLLLFEEPNRANESVIQTMMQILTDRRIHNWVMPEKVIMAACINPEGRYNVNTLDPAVKNRFSIFEVKFDHNSFVEYMKEAGYDNRLIAFTDSGLWVYKSIDEVGDAGHYISSRSFSKVNAILAATKDMGTSSPLFYEMIASVFGKATGSDFLKYVNEIRPVLFEDFERDEDDAFKRLKKILNTTNDYNGDLLSATVNSLTDAYKAQKPKATADLLMKICKIIDLDQATNLVTNTIAHQTTEFTQEFIKQNKKFFDNMKRRREGKQVA